MINDMISFIAIGAFLLAMALLVCGIVAIDRIENDKFDRFNSRVNRFGAFVQAVIFFICVGALSAFIYFLH
jgi:branched-subunit amino acid permease